MIVTRLLPVQLMSSKHISRGTMTFSVLLLGGTGYLGGTVLSDLERAGEYEITCVVRPGTDTCMSDRKVKLVLVRELPGELAMLTCEAS